MCVVIKKVMQDVAKKLQKKKRTAMMKEKTQKKQLRLEEFPTQHDQESRTMSLFFYYPDLLSSFDTLAFLIKLSSPRIRGSFAAKLECSEIHERK